MTLKSILHTVTPRNRLQAAPVGAVLVGSLSAGVSYASIPDSNGVIHGCYKPSNRATTLKVIDTARTAQCPNGYDSITWNQTGPQGPQGDQGPPGPVGQPNYASCVSNDQATVDPGDIVPISTCTTAVGFTLNTSSNSITVDSSGTYRIDFTVMGNPYPSQDPVAFGPAVNGVEVPDAGCWESNYEN